MPPPIWLEALPRKFPVEPRPMLVPDVDMGVPCWVLRVSRGGGSGVVWIRQSCSQKHQAITRPFGSVRNGLPCDELVRVAVARLF
jgi:hypothetical protein